MKIRIKNMKMNIVVCLTALMAVFAFPQYTAAAAEAAPGQQEYGLFQLLHQHDKWGFVLAALSWMVLLGWFLYWILTKERKQRQEREELQRRLWMDEVTGVYNRIGFFENANAMIQRLNGKVCIVRMNIQRFKLVNALYGLENGDLLLLELGKFFSALEEQMHIVVGRFSADQFYLCVSEEELKELPMFRQITLPWIQMDLLLSYGIYPAKGQVDIPLNIMCDRADMAITSGEQAEEDYIYYYNDKAHQILLQEQEIESEMERALEEEQFCIYIQPQYDIETEEITGGEVLVRWKHPEKGLIPPNRFISVFERNGFIRKLDYFVWEQCCRVLAEMKETGLPFIPLSVNVSRIHFFDPELPTALSELVEQYGLTPQELELELTESFCAEEPEIIIHTCQKLREKGFLIAMDDFGSGYSSLNMLKEMPLDIIKMDLRFLSNHANEEQEEKGRHILRTLIELSHALGLQVVVEGLETESQKNFIGEIGGCVAQGYYYSRPVAVADFKELLRTKAEK